MSPHTHVFFQKFPISPVQGHVLAHMDFFKNLMYNRIHAKQQAPHILIWALLSGTKL